MEKNFIIVSLTLFVYQLTAAEELLTHSKILPTSGKNFSIFTWRNFNDDLYFFDTDVITAESTEAVVHLKWIERIFSEFTQSYNCTFTLEKNLTDSKVRKVDEHKVLVAYGTLDPTSNVTEWKIKLLDLPTCDTVDQKASVHAESIFFGHFYDFFFINSTLCEDKYCKMTVDSELNVKDDAKPWIDIYGDQLSVVKVVTTSVDLETIELYSVVQTASDGKPKNRFSLVSKEGPKLLLESDADFVSLPTNNEIIGLVFCTHFNEQNETVHHVYQWDLEGTPKLSVELNSTGMNDHAYMMNHVEGGFTLVTSKDVESGYTLYATKYDETGKAVSKPLEIEGFEKLYDFKFSNHINFYENEDNMYCLLQWRKSESRDCETEICVEVFEKCFNNEDMDDLEDVSI